MSSVNGLGNTATFEKYQGGEKIQGKRVEASSKNQGPQGVGGTGNQAGRGRLDVDAKKSAAGGKAQKADPFKEILKVLKGLIETLSAMIAKLSGSASSESSSTAATMNSAGSSAGGSAGNTAGTTTTAPSQPSSAQPTSSSSGSKDTTGVTTAGTTSAEDASTDAASADSSAVPSSAVSSSASPNDTVTSVISTGASSDDLTVREETESALVTKTSATTAPQQGEGLQALKDETGAVSVLTDDGFTIRADVKDQAWTIAGPDGFATRIWGDPHVAESDGDAWDFLKQSTFLFGKNKVTVEVVPAGNGMTYSSRISVYSGDGRVTISGIETNSPTIDAVARDGEQHDAQLSDGVIFTRGSNTRGESWSQLVDGKKDVMGH